MKGYGAHEKQRFSIRKYAFGVASVLLGVTILFAGGQVQAEEAAAVTTDEPVASTQGLAIEETSSEIEDNQSQAERVETEVTAESAEETAVDSSSTAESVVADSEVAQAETPQVTAEHSDDESPAEREATASEEDQATAPVATPDSQAIAEEKRQAAAEGQTVRASRTRRSASEAAAVAGNLVIENQSADGFDVFIRDMRDANGIVAVKVPVWTAKSGQDDIIWYDAARQDNGDYHVSVAKNRHKNEAGLYHVHLYYVEPNGQLVGVAGTEVTLAGTTDQRKKLANSGYYTFEEEVEVKNQARMSAPTEFTFKRGERIFYDRVLETDNYQWISYVSYSGTRRYIPLASLPAAVAQAPQSDSQRSGSLSFSDQSDGNFRVSVTNVSDSKGIRQVKVPVWTAASGQDDIVWYDAIRQNDGSYTVDVKRSQHKDAYGHYHVHLYYVEGDGRLAGVAAAEHTTQAPQSKQSAQLTISQPDANGFTVSVTNIQASYVIRDILVPVWSESGGQDDIVWYRASRQNDGSYQASVRLADHKYSTGVYQAHLYFVSDDGQLHGVGGSQTTVSQVNRPSSNLPSSGRYTFNNRVEVRNQASLSAPVVFNLDAGQSINYDRLENHQGRQWLSYLSYSGTRRYIAL